jgi:branched-chain amino acid transport system ATP-binding protein
VDHEVPDVPILAADGVRKQFGALVVLDGVALEVAAGHALGIVGPNGAGKTTLLDALSGAQRPNAGSVSFRGAAGSASGAPIRSRGRSPT